MKLNEKNQIRKSSCGDKRIDPELSTSFLPVVFFFFLIESLNVP